MRKSQLIFIGFVLSVAFSVNASVLLPFNQNDDAFEQLYQSAEQGNAESQYQLALWYERENSADYPTIVSWLYRAAQQDMLEAQFALGHIYQYGKPGIQPDLLEAEKWYEQAALKGYRQALQALNFLQNQRAYKMVRPPSLEDKWEVQWTSQSATYGDVQSQFDLGRLYAEGKKVQQDYVKAAIWYEKAAAQEHIESMYALANLYLDGLGIEKDVKKALFWFKQAAMRDYIPAQRRLYEVYSKRLDKSEIRVKAASWLYLSLAYLFPDEKDLTTISPELKDLWARMTDEEKEKALYFAYSFIDENRVNK